MSKKLSRTPNAYYAELDNLRAELNQVIAGNDGKFPTWGQLEDLDRTDILSGIRKHGGIHAVREKVGFEHGIKPTRYWTEHENIRAEAKRVMEKHQLKQLPSKETLAELGHSSLAAAITTNYPGQYRGLRTDLGQTVSSKPYGYWDDPANVENEVQSVMTEYHLSRVPSRNFLEGIDRMDLIGGMRHYPGGMTKLRKKFQEKNLRKSVGYWRNIKNVKTEARRIIEELGELPGKGRLSDINASLAAAIVKYHGGFQQFRKMLGEERKRVDTGYWDDPKNIEREVRKLKRKEELDYLPSQKTLADLGYGYLVAAITGHYPGGMKQYRKDHRDYTEMQASEKTAQMLKTEEEIGEPIEQFLAREYQLHGSTRIARDLGLTDVTVLEWIKFFGIQKNRPAKTEKEIETYIAQSPVARSIVNVASLNQSYGDVADIFVELWPDKFPSTQALSEQLPKLIPRIAASISPITKYERAVQAVYTRLPIEVVPENLENMLYRIGIDVYQAGFNRDPKGTMRRLINLQVENKYLPAKKMIDKVYGYFESAYSFQIPGIGSIQQRYRI